MRAHSAPSAAPELSGAELPDHLAPRPAAAFLSARELALRHGTSEATLSRMRREGSGPPFINTAARIVRYPVAHLLEWEAAQIRASTSLAGHRP